jgi:hypothetical protein
MVLYAFTCNISLIVPSESFFDIAHEHMKEMSVLMEKMLQRLQDHQGQGETGHIGNKASTSSMQINEEESLVTISITMDDVKADMLDSRMYTDRSGQQYMKLILPGERTKTVIMISNHNILVESKIEKKDSGSTSHLMGYQRNCMRLPSEVNVSDSEVEYDEATKLLTVRLPKTVKKKRIIVKKNKYSS